MINLTQINRVKYLTRQKKKKRNQTKERGDVCGY